MYVIEDKVYLFDNSAFNKVLLRLKQTKSITIRELTINLYKHLHNSGFSASFMIIKSDEDYDTAKRRINRWRAATQPKPFDANLIFSIEKFLGLSKGSLLKLQEEICMKKTNTSNVAVVTKLMDIHTQISEFMDYDCMDGNEDKYGRLMSSIEALEIFSDAFSKIKEFATEHIAPIVFSESDAIEEISKPYQTEDGNLNFETEKDFLLFMGKHFEITMSVKREYEHFFMTEIIENYV